MKGLLDLPQTSLDKKIRLITTFSGIGSQEMALRDIGADFEIYKAIELDKYAMASYNAIHGTDFEPTDICTVSGKDLEIVDTDKYDYIFVYSYPCFTADTFILTDSGYKQIVDVKPGDYVLTHDNQWQKVINFFDNGKKQIYNVRTMPTDDLKCTSNHRFYVRERYRKYPCYSNGKRGNERHFKEAVWKECKDLTKNDYVGIAVNQKSEIPEWDGIEISWKNTKRVDKKDNLKSLIDKNAFWWLMGYYLGDGWERTQGGIVLAANDIKLEKLKTVLEKLNFNPYVIKERTCYKVHLPFKELSAFVQMFGKYAYGKRVPIEVINLPVDLLKSFLEGYFTADGYVRDTKIKISTVSREMVYGLAQCIAKVYKRPYLLYKTHRKETCVIEGRTVHQRDGYVISFKTTNDKQDKGFYENGYLWCPINSIEKLDEQNVYDIEVENNHSFTANGVIVHNCTSISVAGKMEGMKEDSGTASSLVWEIKRILQECYDLSKNTDKYGLPKILLMENVPQVHSPQNMPEFQRLIDFLSSLGYYCWYQDLNARDFGIPQNRERCFMVSILSDEFIDFEFPKPVKLEKVMKDFLENSVDEKYYINNEKAEKLIEQLVERGVLADIRKANSRKCVDLCLNKPEEINIANCITARYDCGISNLQALGSGVVEQR